MMWQQNETNEHSFLTESLFYADVLNELSAFMCCASVERFSAFHSRSIHFYGSVLRTETKIAQKPRRVIARKLLLTTTRIEIISPHADNS